MSDPLRAAFLDALTDEENRVAASLLADLPAQLAGLLARARAVHPQFVDDSCQWVSYLGARVGRTPLDQYLSRLAVADLTLARACALGLPGAIELFEDSYGRELAAVVRRFERTHNPDDLRQILRERLFVAPAGSRPKISEYAGQGFLINWARVTAVRAFLDLEKRRDRSRESHADDDAIMRLPDPADDLELDFLKREYRAAFATAFEQAATALSPGDRNLLRQHHTAGLSIDRLAALHSIHRATAARRVEAARNRLLHGTRDALMKKLALDDNELDSIMALIASRIDLSVRRVLTTDES